MNRDGYDDWEAHRLRYAFEEADRLIKLYNEENVEYLEYISDQSKPVQEYCMMKIWMLLHTNGIYMEHKIYRKKDKIRVCIRLASTEN